MQNGTLKAVAHSMRKSGFYPAIAVDEANAIEGRRLLRTDTNPKLFEDRKAIGHDAFATCFVNGGMSAIDDGNGEAGPPGCNGSGKSTLLAVLSGLLRPEVNRLVRIRTTTTSLA